METSNATWNMLSVWRARVAQSEPNEIKRTAQSGAVHGAETVVSRSTNTCLPFAVQTMASTPNRF